MTVIGEGTLNQKKLNDQLAANQPAWMEINLKNAAFNLKCLQRNLGEQVKIMPVVKADAYGHGALAVSRVFERCGAMGLAVANVAEGVELRKAGISLPIYVLEHLLPEESEQVVEYDLSPVVHSMELARKLSIEGRVRQKTVHVQVRVDTGSGIMGLHPDKVLPLLREIKGLSWLALVGIFTHLTAAYDCEYALVSKQLDLFERTVQLSLTEDLEVPLVHAASSPVILCFPEAHFNIVRPGTLPCGKNRETGRNKRISIRLTLMKAFCNLFEFKTISINKQQNTKIYRRC